MTTALVESRYEIQSFTVQYAAAEPLVHECLTQPRAVATTAQALFRTMDAGQEHFAAFYLNVQNEVLAFKHLSSGTLDQVAVYPRIILRNALLLGAAGVIIVHNHPSGYILPSEDDKRLTYTLRDSGRALDIRTLDHLVINDRGDFFSFREQGLL